MLLARGYNEGSRDSLHKKVSPMLVTFILVGMMVFVILGGIRLYSMRLESRLAKMDAQIRNYGEQLTKCQQEIAFLTSPAKVYCYATSKLKMHNIKYSGTVAMKSTDTDIQKSPLVVRKNFGLADRVLNLVSRRASAGE